ncbi:MAG: MgtC/SapB family protein [Deltaproteobacteria bacterium]|nr:MgtC/SapB family protein [Deltaproteobacteria bacterium]
MGGLPITAETILFRLALAALLGTIIGFEREVHGRPAGLRTNIVVAVASCLLMIISLELTALFENLDSKSTVRVDPGRIASYAVAGMGFIGAGAIMQGRGSIRGLTSAASLWAGNAIGLAVGAGFFLAAVIATGFVLIALFPLRNAYRAISKDTDIMIIMEFETCDDKIWELREIFHEYRVKVLNIAFECELEVHRSKYEVEIRLKSNKPWAELQSGLRRLEDLTRIHWAEGEVR